MEDHDQAAAVAIIGEVRQRLNKLLGTGQPEATPAG